jgi:probable rRNA maturation factor
LSFLLSFPLVQWGKAFFFMPIVMSVVVSVMVDPVCGVDRRAFWEGMDVQGLVGRTLATVPGWNYNQGAAMVCVRITDVATMRQYNHKHRHRDTSTNILSFPMTLPDQPFVRTPQGDVVLGDLLVCDDDVVDQAQAQGKTVIQHATHLLVHGVLHLLHYDHETEDEATVMETLERRILADLGWPCPYGDDV